VTLTGSDMQAPANTTADEQHVFDVNVNVARGIAMPPAP
jgi:hypothetical protein